MKFSFDIEKLSDHLVKAVLPLPPVLNHKNIGGWTVLSSNGSYKDGWHNAAPMMNTQMSHAEIAQIIAKSGGKSPQSYVHPTEVCTGYMMEVVKKIQSLGFAPVRARISRLEAGDQAPWHRDSPDHIYSARLHVPMVTNEGCWFETREAKAHLAADGSVYVLFVNREHRVYNLGSSPRYHLIMDIWDHNDVTEYHRLSGWLPKGKTAG